VGSAIVTLYDGFLAYFSSLNVEPLTTRVMDFLHIPPDLRGLTLSAAVTGLGLAMVRLRKTVTKPLELVAAPTTLPPAATAAVARAEATQNAAVAAVQVATK